MSLSGFLIEKISFEIQKDEGVCALIKAGHENNGRLNSDARKSGETRHEVIIKLVEIIQKIFLVLGFEQVN